MRERNSGLYSYVNQFPGDLKSVEPIGNDLVRAMLAQLRDAGLPILTVFNHQWIKLLDGRQCEIVGDYLTPDSITLIAAFPSAATAREVVEVELTKAQFA